MQSEHICSQDPTIAIIASCTRKAWQTCNHASVLTHHVLQKSAVPSATGNPQAAGASTHAPGRACWLSGHMHAWDAKPCCACACVWMNICIYIYIYIYIQSIVYMYILFPTSSRLELEWLQVMHACTDMSWLLGHAQINANPCVHQRSGPSIMASVAHSAMYLHSKIMNLKLFSCMDADEKVYVHVHGFRTCMVMNALPRMHGRKSIFFHCWGRSQYCLVKTVRGTFDFGSGGTSSCKQHDMQASVHGTCTHQSMEHACFEYIRWAIRALHFSWRGWFHISGLTTHQQ